MKPWLKQFESTPLFCLERKDIFRSRKDREQFLSYLESSVVRYGTVIHAYCLMSYHYHLLMETQSAYTDYYNSKIKRSGHLFQGSYKAILTGADTYAKELSRWRQWNGAATVQKLYDAVSQIPAKGFCRVNIGKKHNGGSHGRIEIQRFLEQ